MHAPQRLDFAMVGIPYGDHVMVVASDKLTEAQLEAEHDYIRTFGSNNATRIHSTYTLSVEMRQYVAVTAPTYAEAFAKLFDQWTPTPADRPALAGDRTIDAGQSVAAL
ncbi:hypothetical protein [Rhodococcus sp. MEB064]|uniref:hypothetical protein n=1 Tax=Rhodococcus sp. MEB064 TaxID=1587522 RepID=UPI0012DFEA12|nr:hypothetical protein [Rhodococcus sp. MEB064]